jgi:hypothetical protein
MVSLKRFRSKLSHADVMATRNGDPVPDGRKASSHVTAPRRTLTLTLLFGLVLIVGLVTAAPSIAKPTTPAANWTQQAPTESPSVRQSASMAYDPAIGKVVLFGGFTSLGGEAEYFDDTWTYDGTTWSKQSPATSPPAGSGASMVYDPAIGKVVLFGGGGGDIFSGDTWTYDGTTWTKQSPAGPTPPARTEPSMAYDSAIGKVVLFGGSGGAEESETLSDTWTYDGTTWTKQSPAGPNPSSRAGASMAYDPAIGKVVLFGGFGEHGFLEDTWTYDGTTWTEQSPATSPPASVAGSMTYDTAIGKVFLFGGASIGGSLDDTWTYDGTTWTEQSPATSPPARIKASMEYDSGTGQLVLFGGTGEAGRLSDTWTYQQLPSPPTATITSPVGGQTYVVGQSVRASFSCTEGARGPGIESCTDSNGSTTGTGTLDTTTAGEHTYSVTAVSKDGEESEEGEAQVTYTVTKASSSMITVTPPSAPPAPSVRILYSPNHPHAPNPKGGPRYTFRFTDAAPGVTFYCKLDKGPFKVCHPPKVYRGLKRGRHHFAVKSVNAAGLESTVERLTFYAGRRGRS